MKAAITILLACAALQTNAQQISGRMYDEKREPVIKGIVAVYQDGRLRGITETDYDGNYIVKPLSAGSYVVSCGYAGYDSIKITGVTVTDGNTRVNFDMQKQVAGKSGMIVNAYKKPLTASSLITYPYEQPLTADNPVSNAPDGSYYVCRGRQVEMGGARTGGVMYILDGNPVTQLPEPMMVVAVPQYPAVDGDNPSSRVLTRQRLDRMPWTSLRDVVSTMPGVYQRRRGDEVRIYGSGPGGVAYIVDGVRQQ